jgi:hypothetical protein
LFTYQVSVAGNPHQLQVTPLLRTSLHPVAGWHALLRWLLLLLFGELQNVDEDEILIRFALACRRNGQRLGLNGGVKKARAGSVKPRGR